MSRQFLQPGADPRRVWPWIVVAVAGVAACAATLALPWRDEEFRPSRAVLALVAASGVALLALVSWQPRRGASGVVTATGILGVGVLAYPSLLTLAAAGVGGPVLATAGAAGHVLPLTMVQLIPVLGSQQVLGRSRRGWVRAIVGIAVVGFVLTGLAVSGIPGGETVALVTTLVWFASFLLAPIATWLGVRGSVGEARRRAIVAALSSLFPLTIISWCVALGGIGASLGWGPDQSASALMTGFALGTWSCGATAIGAVGAPPHSFLLRTRTIVFGLHGMIAALLAILGWGVALAVGSAASVAPAWAAVMGAAVAVAVVLPWQRLHAWLARVVDPGAELRAALAGLDRSAEQTGGHRQGALQVLRRLLDDPHLELVYDPPAAEDPADGEDPAGDVVLAWSDAGTPSVLLHPSSSAVAARVARVGDLSGALRPALLEARAAAASRRADAAAEAERRRLSQDLHDGLQGRLLGIALNLHLTARDIADPAARLTLERTVDALREAVDDVRALGGGRLPRLLADEGLPSALTALLQPVSGLVSLEVPAVRLAPAVETTAYFVVGEAVTNALKHARARRVEVRVTEPDAGQVTVRVLDDGVGGADPRLGSGLRSLSERVAAEGGVLVVHEGVPHGTVVEAVLPCAS